MYGACQVNFPAQEGIKERQRWCRCSRVLSLGPVSRVVSLDTGVSNVRQTELLLPAARNASTRIVAFLDIVPKTTGKIPRTKERGPRTGYRGRKEKKRGGERIPRGNLPISWEGK